MQWWGTQGSLHGLNPAPAKPGQRGKKLHGQYYEATPGHASELDQPLDEATRLRWQSLLAVDRPAEIKSRGDLIRTAYKQALTASLPEVTEPVVSPCGKD